MDDIRNVTVAEAASILGKTPDAVRGLIRRGTLTSIRGNDGRPRVVLSTGQATVATPETPENDSRETGGAVATTNRDALLVDLRERLDRAEGAADQLRQQVAGLLSERDRIVEQRAPERFHYRHSDSKMNSIGAK